VIARLLLVRTTSKIVSMTNPMSKHQESCGLGLFVQVYGIDYTLGILSDANTDEMMSNL
jgi:hypothetical protein